VNDLGRAPSARGMSVRDDWRASLPDEKYRVFRSYEQQLETSYNMLSVSLNEALALQQSGRCVKASQAVCVTPELCERFANPLVALLWSLSEHAKHYGTVPNAAPLDPANFLGARGQRVALLSGLLCKVLFSHRQQFLHKISTLSEMVDDLNQDFRAAAAAIAASSALAPDDLWASIDATHYDLNTCFREAVVLLKSFLISLPESELGTFQATVRVQMGVAKPNKSRKSSLTQRLLRHRRVAALSGE
jgi:hypothetical protein